MLKSNGAFRAVRFTEVVRISEGQLKGFHCILRSTWALHVVNMSTSTKSNFHIGKTCRIGAGVAVPKAKEPRCKSLFLHDIVL